MFVLFSVDRSFMHLQASEIQESQIACYIIITLNMLLLNTVAVQWRLRNSRSFSFGNPPNLRIWVITHSRSLIELLFEKAMFVLFVIV